MAGSSAGLHEAGLSEGTVDRHRAIVSIMEDLEAVDWYDQRAEATTDGALAEILGHNREEDKEHAVMTLEWLRRDPRSAPAHLPVHRHRRPGHRASGRARHIAIDRQLARHRQPQDRDPVNHLHRELAPISDEAWAAIDDEARGRLTTFLAARKLVDFSGPHGWAHSAYDLGRVNALAAGPAPGVEAATRQVQPLVELHTELVLSREVLDSIDRGAPDPDLDAVVDAARRMALAEDTLVFGGSSPTGIEGITQATPHAPIAMPDDFDQFPTAVAKAVGVLREGRVGTKG